MTYADAGRHRISPDLVGPLVAEKSRSVCCDIRHGELYVPALVISARQELREVVVSPIRPSDLAGENREAVCVTTPPGLWKRS